MTREGNATLNSIPEFACYNTTFDLNNRIWRSDNVISERVPLLSIQIAYNILASSFFHHILKRFHLPLTVAQMLGGVLLSSSFLGRIPGVFHMIYRPEGIMSVETFANVGIMYYVFLTGLEMNCDTILRSSKQAVVIAVASILIPALVGAGFLALQNDLAGGSSVALTAKGYMFWCAILSVTSFPVLARLLSDLKILYTRLGKDALTAAILIDTFGWVLFSLFIPFSHQGGKPLLSLMCTLLFIVICFCVVRPILARVVEHRMRSESWNSSKLLDVMMGLFVCAYITDLLGSHHVVGAFVYGLILPSGKFADLLLEMLDDFVTAIIVPVYFASFGFRLNLESLWSENHTVLLPLFMVFLLAIPKILSSLLVTVYYGMSSRDGVGLGLLLNTKGIMAVILISIAWDKSILDPYAFTIMILAVLFMTTVVSPFINAIYKPKLRFKQTQQRTVQKLWCEAELRVAACVHNYHQALGMIYVLEATNATRTSPLHVSVLHLVELTRRGTGLLVAQIDNTNVQGGSSEQYGSQEEFETICNAFNEFVEEYKAVRFDTSGIVATYETIHQDIYNVTEEKRANLILLPFHKQLSSGELETTKTAFCDINQNVLQAPPCSVGILVNRGLRSLSTATMSIIVIFIGGPDDREALSIAWRMASHSATKLHVVRLLVSGTEVAEGKAFQNDSSGVLSTEMDSVMQKELDDEHIFHFRHKGLHNCDSITYSERELRLETGEEIPSILHEIDQKGCDLYILGQGSGSNYTVFKRLLEWCDSPELGVMGDIVASSSFGTNSSLLVVQQYTMERKSKLHCSRKYHTSKVCDEIL
ncbi:hypothetical protein LR48_Vigan02g064200 [Vigna angularis]|uniref:Uncharacterized protein n=1 Tax=Phaseolus angularis TaxID=3914 RepID=A0A0L9TVS5_PHAAN|nr:cation/H(+) antiporter 15 [Vigna angularis]KOM34492.1 hypothetical protein LR48_Vigan02g064200 [Vigna angularis]